MIIIGFDPGIGHTGYAVLNKTGNDISIIECGLVSPKINKSISELHFYFVLIFYYALRRYINNDFNN